MSPFAVLVRLVVRYKRCDVDDALNRTSHEEWRVIDELFPSLRRLAGVMAPSDMDPDDLLQEALVKVLSHCALSELDHPGAYLRRTMLNLAASHYRHMGRRRHTLTRLAASAEQVPDATYPSDLAELYRLPPRERAVLYLAEVEGYHFDEIAEMLGCSKSAARKGASRGRRRLRLALTTGDTG
jgi:RNA polymerase sigma-70 factor (ECF subfamily)